MKIPRLVWHRRHNVAALTVSFGKRIWQTREVGDLILGYNAAGRLSRVVLLDPRRLLADDATAADAVAAVTQSLLRSGGVRQAELDVLRSALDRASAPNERPEPPERPTPGTLPLDPRSRTSPVIGADTAPDAHRRQGA
jgi:hypothetical protein